MGQGRGSAFWSILIVSICLILHLQYGDAANFTVGDSNGWNIKINGWTDGKFFRKGDILSFNYNPKFHSVVIVDEIGFNTCKPNSKAQVFRSGSDKIEISKGNNYFICGAPGHCAAGMKIAVNACD